MRCAFLTMDDLGEYVSDDDLAIPELNNLGWDVEKVSWRADADWTRFDAVVIRTTWDYQDHADHFFDVLTQVVSAGTRVYNSVGLVRWNMRKTYLRDLAGMGLPVVATLFGRGLRGVNTEVLYSSLDTEELVVKPVVSATAQRTYRIRKGSHADRWEEIVVSLGEDAYVVQPFIGEVVSEGEYSVIFLGGSYSHTILKTPTAGDFRVQEEHGGTITEVNPEKDLMHLADQFVRWIEPTPLYARVDLVRSGDHFLLMELELIEPSLYLRMNSEAPARFAESIVAASAG